MNKILLLSLFIFILVLAQGRGIKPKKIKPGSICTVDDVDGKYGVVKILVINDEIIHLKVYKNKYNYRPTTVDTDTLNIGSVNDTGGAAVVYMSMSRKDFDGCKPISIAFEDVNNEELEAYEIWQAQ